MMSELRAFRRIHVIGVAGAGMSALAKILAGRGHQVTGSDLRGGIALSDLSDLGLDVWSGHRPGAVADADLVVASSAVPDSDPELTAAQRAGVVVWRRPRLLDALTSDVPTIGATGTHGKTSSTGMLIAATRSVGLDPSFVIGGELVEYRTNAVVGQDDLLVLEIDEAFGTFEHVHARGLMVTNVEADHLDHFGSYDEVEAAFERVARSVDGPVVVCRDDPGGARLAERIGATTYGVGSGDDGPFADRHWSVTPGAAGRFVLARGGRALDVQAPRAGTHMMLNAAGVVALMAELGHDPIRAASGVATFRGVARRFERKGTVAGVTVIDDYAHHPTEIAATLAEARLTAEGRVIAVFQPHLYSRTEALAGAFAEALTAADRVFVTDIYGSRETPRPGVTGALVADAARTVDIDVSYVPHMADLPLAVAAETRPGDLVVILGAGDITVIAVELLLEIERLGAS